MSAPHGTDITPAGHGAGEDDHPDAREGELVTTDDPRFPVADPGMEEHLPRLTDVDEKAAKRAELQVTGLFAVVPIFAIAFIVIYFAVPMDMTIDFDPLIHTNAKQFGLGATLGMAILLIGVGAVQWARQLMSDKEMVDERHPAVSSKADREQVMEELEAGIDESQITRRKMIGRSLIGAVGIIVVPFVVLLADLGPVATKKVRQQTIEDDDLGGRSPAGQRRHLHPDQARRHRTRSTRQRRAGQSARSRRHRTPGGDGQMPHHHRPDEPERDQDPRQPSRLAGRGDLRLFQDLHPRRLSDQPVGTPDPSPALSLSPVDLRPRATRAW